MNEEKNKKEKIIRKEKIKTRKIKMLLISFSLSLKS
jgi:hypothetical protein